VSLYKKDKQWYIKEKNDFYADDKKVFGLLYDLSLLKIAEKKTKNPKKYKYLGLEYKKNADKKATLVVIKDKKTTKKIYFGTVVPEGGRSNSIVYARFDKNPQSWKLSGNIELSVDSDFYLQKEFSLLDSIKIKKISFNKNKVSIDRNSSNAWTSFKQLNQRKVDDFVKMFERLTIVDYKKKKSKKYRAKPFASFIFKGSKSILVSIVKIKKKYYLDIKGSGKKVFDKWLIQTDFSNDIKKQTFKSMLKQKTKKKKK
jgi:ribosomal protein L35AE/L33A